MKKIFYVVLIGLFATIIIIGCSDNVYPLVLNKVSEVRRNILTYRDEEIYSTIMSGEREEEYKVDGIHNNNINFTIITLDFVDKAIDYNTITIEFSTTINGKNYTGKMIQNPFDNSFVYDLQISLDDLQEADIDFVIDQKIYHAHLSNIRNDWKVQSNDALKIAVSDLKEYIKSSIEDNEFLGEAYIKFVFNEKYSNDYYWYINIVTINKNNYSLIIDPNTGEIKAKNIS